MTEYKENKELLTEESYLDLDLADEENEKIADIYTDMMNNVAYKTR